MSKDLHHCRKCHGVVRYGYVYGRGPNIQECVAMVHPLENKNILITMGDFTREIPQNWLHTRRTDLLKRKIRYAKSILGRPKYIIMNVL
jgi:hypothetical protein